MPAEEIREVVAELHSSLEEFASALAGLTESDASRSPAEGRWSAKDCTEHLFLVEERFQMRLDNAPKDCTATSIDRTRESSISTSLGNREVKAQAPEVAQPTGRYSTLAETLANLSSARLRTVAYVESQGETLYTLNVEHPRFGVMNGAEFLKLSTFHTRRHAAQIREIRSQI